MTKPTRVVVLSSQHLGFASFYLPPLLTSPRVEVAGIVFSEGLTRKTWQKRWRKLRKTFDIGLLGALNGIRMRRWYELSDLLELEPLDELAKRNDVRFESSPSLFDERAVELCRAANADLGLSLGNSYISERVFSAPRLGTINIHHEILPAFQGAKSVIWQLHEGSSRTGFTIGGSTPARSSIRRGSTLCLARRSRRQSARLTRGCGKRAAQRWFASVRSSRRSREDRANRAPAAAGRHQAGDSSGGSRANTSFRRFALAGSTAHNTSS